MFVAFIFSAVCALYAQTPLSTKDKKAVAAYTEADNYRVRGQYAHAVELLNKAIARAPAFFEAHFRLGLTYKSMKQFERSNRAFETGMSLTRDARWQRAFIFELGDNLMKQGRYEEALPYLTRYLNEDLTNKPKIEYVQALKRNAEFGLSNKNDAIKFEQKPLSDTVNCFAMQYFPVLTADEQQMIYTRRRGNRPEDDEDLVISTRQAGGWSPPASLSAAINSSGNEGTCTISADGRQLIFTSCAGRKGFGNCDLFETRKVGDEWTLPVNMGAQINSAAWESQPSLSADGRVLYFVSDRKGGLGQRDIYVSYKLDDKRWTKAENLGPAINTPFDEISPFIHVNNKDFFFASTGRAGYGGYDIYRTERTLDGWGPVVNVGHPINNHEDQFSLFITADSERGYYSHEKSGQQNTSLIYQFRVPEELQLKFKSSVVKGVVTDAATGQKLKSRVELFNLNENRLESVVTSDSVSGEYLIVLTQGAEYALYVSAPGYLFQSLHFNFENEQRAQTIFIDVALAKAGAGATAVLNNIFFDVDKYDLKDRSKTELARVIEFLRDNPAIRVEIAGHTDNTGDENYNAGLSLKRATAVAEFLKSGGIAGSRLVIHGYGSRKPLKPNDSDENRQLNRRIEFKILN